MLIGDHPVKGPGDEIDNPACPHSWVLACWAGGCCARYVVPCAGGAHVLLSVAVERAAGAGWALGGRGAGWRCPACLERLRAKEREHIEPEPVARGASFTQRRRKRCPLVRNGSLRGSETKPGRSGMQPLFAVEGT